MKGTLTEVRPGVWRARVYTGRKANGQPRQVFKTIYAPDKRPKWGAGKRLAEDELAKMITEVTQGKMTSGTETLGELLDQYLEHCQTTKGLSPTTIRKYHSIVESTIRPELGHVRLSKLTARDLDSLYGKLTAEGRKATTVQQVHRLIGAALHQAEKRNMIASNIARMASPPRVQRTEIEVPSPEAVQAMVRAAAEDDATQATFLALAAMTSARRGELLALRWSDIDFEDATVTFSRSVYDPKGKVGIEKVHQDSPGSHHLHLHALRHFGPTEAIAAGMDPVTVSKRLGHARPSITLDIYSHALEQQDKELAITIGRTLAVPAALPLGK